MIDIRKLKELIKLMVENDLSEIDLRDEQETVVLKRPYATGGQAPVAMGPPMIQQAPQQAQGGAPASGGGDASPAAPVDDGLEAIESPMVGTFYSAPDPESPPFVSEGAQVRADSVVCIVEAMKVFSEIKAEVSGTVEQVLVQNGQPVEFGQPLFLVRPS